MVDGLQSVGADRSVVPLSSRRAAQAAPAATSAPATSDAIPELPPAEVLDALDTAARVLHELDRKQVSIRLEHDTSTNQLHAHVSDAGGEQQISQTQLLNVLSGDTASLHTKG